MINKQKGFSLIELVVVLVIIGLMTSFALPAYQNYIAKTQASEVLQLIEPLRLQLYENVHNDSKCITGNTTEAERQIGQRGKFGSATIANTTDYNVNLTKNDVDEAQNELSGAVPEEDTGCRIYVKFRTTGTNAKIRDTDFTLAMLYNGQLVFLDQGDGATKLISKKFIPSQLIRDTDYIQDKKNPTINNSINLGEDSENQGA